VPSVGAYTRPVPPSAAELKARKAAETLDRLLSDGDLLLRLQLSGYADKEWEPIATELGLVVVPQLRHGHGDLPASRCNSRLETQHGQPVHRDPAGRRAAAGARHVSRRRRAVSVASDSPERRKHSLLLLGRLLEYAQVLPGRLGPPRGR